MFQVFNRWGGKVFEKTNVTPGNYSDGWNGTFRGKPVDAGVYIYNVEVVFADGVTLTYTGDVTVFE